MSPSASAQQHLRSPMPYAAGLDGVRALAVVAVLLYHGQDLEGIPSWLEPTGGFLGVEVFFVISGYLITSLLLGEFAGSGSIDIRNFWVRRIRRLVPALVVFLAGTAALAALFGSDALSKIRSEIVGAVFYVSNWVLITTDESYFEAAGRPSLLRHLWSLAIEGQFYVVWPIVVLVVLRVLGTRSLVGLSVLGVVGAIALMWTLFDGIDRYGDVSSIYYRTDARAGALLVGAGAACLWRPWLVSDDERRLPTMFVRAVDVLGLAAVLALIALQYVFTDRVIEWDRYVQLYHGGFLVVSLLTAVIIAAVVTPSSWLAVLLGNPVLRWIGLRSYGIYLWHWPVFMLSRPDVDVDLDGWTLLAIRWAITLALVEVSYRLVEVPVRQRRFTQPLLSGVRTPRGMLIGTVGALALIATTAGVAIALPAVDHGSDDIFGVAISEPQSLDTALGSLALTTPPPAATPRPTATAAPTATVEPTSTAEALRSFRSNIPVDPDADFFARVQQRAEGVEPSPTPTQAPLAPPAPLAAPVDIEASSVYVFGDSVLLGAAGQLQRIGPVVTIDGKVGRQWWEAPAELQAARANGLAGDVVIIQLGNNGSFSYDMFQGVMNALSGTRLVLFINVRAPVPWEGEVNGLLTRAVDQFPDQARLIDWYSVSNDRPEYFIDDATHLSGAGQTAFRLLIESAMIQLS